MLRTALMMTMRRMDPGRWPWRKEGATATQGLAQLKGTIARRYDECRSATKQPGKKPSLTVGGIQFRAELPPVECNRSYADPDEFAQQKQAMIEAAPQKRSPGGRSPCRSRG